MQEVGREYEASDFDPYVAPIRNRDQVIRDLKADLRIKTETIDRLQFDVERLRSRRIGLETEVKAREAQTRKLAKAVDEANRQIDTLTSALHEAKKSYDEVSGRLASAHAQHEEELRTVRFELTEAAETVAQQPIVLHHRLVDQVGAVGHRVAQPAGLEDGLASGHALGAQAADGGHLDDGVVHRDAEQGAPDDAGFEAGESGTEAPGSAADEDVVEADYEIVEEAEDK